MPVSAALATLSDHAPKIRRAPAPYRAIAPSRQPAPKAKIGEAARGDVAEELAEQVGPPSLRQGCAETGPAVRVSQPRPSPNE